MTKAAVTKTAPVVAVVAKFEFKPLDKSAIDKQIAGIINRSAKLDKDIHMVALQCLYHADKHGDVTLFNRLYLGLAKGMKRNALASWAMAFGKFVVSKEDDKKELPLAFDRTKTTNLEEAAAKPWYTFKTEKELEEIIDVQDVLVRLLKRLTKEGAKVSDPELVTRLARVVNPTSDETV